MLTREVVELARLGAHEYVLRGPFELHSLYRLRARGGQWIGFEYIEPRQYQRRVLSEVVFFDFHLTQDTDGLPGRLFADVTR